ncbi:MAG TPA: hypothetical protein VFB44_01420 [Thermoleophilaceae bacterium]|nr:hypothetical protein [Thermoleophilaceae bacterium]
MTRMRLTPFLLAAPVAMLAGLAPATAGAADYCVAPNTGCGGTPIPNLEQALDLADNATDPDRVFLGAAIYTAPTTTGFYYSESSSPVQIIGQGRGQTVLTAPSAASFVLRLLGGAGSSVNDLTIRLPQTAAAGLKGLSTSGLGRRVEVIEDATQANNRSGVELFNGGTLEDSSVALGSGQDTVGVLLETGGGAVRRSSASAKTAVHSEYGGAIEQSQLTGSEAGVIAYRNTTAIRSSLIRFTATPGAGIGALTRKGSPTTVTADGVTIVGPNVLNTFGVAAVTGILTGSPVAVSLTNSIIRGAERPLYAAADVSTAKISASYSDYNSSANLVGARGGNEDIAETNVSNVGDAGFVDAVAGDYRLRAGSALIDSGDPITQQGLDLDGNPLVMDGNGDGLARRDLGAYELPPALPPAAGDAPPTVPAVDREAPLVSGFRAAPALFAVRRGTRFRYTLSEQARVTLTIQRKLPGGRHRVVGRLRRNATSGRNSTRFTGKIRARALRPGRYRALIRASDAAGNRSVRKATRFRIAAR